MKTGKFVLTGEHKAAMKDVRNGADVRSHKIATLLREVEREMPALIEIGPCMGEYDGAGVLPYFGAILTKEGRKAIREAKP